MTDNSRLVCDILNGVKCIREQYLEGKKGNWQILVQFSVCWNWSTLETSKERNWVNIAHSRYGPQRRLWGKTNFGALSI